MSGRGLRALASPITVLLGLAVPASATETYCVSCSGPQASYLCEVTVPDGVVASQSPQLYCAYRLASDGHHASCASRRTDAASCQGEPRRLAYEGPSLTTPPVSTPAAAPVEPALPGDTALPEPVTGTTATDQAVDPAVAPEPVAPADDDAGKDTSRVGEEDVAAPIEAAEPSTGDKIAGVAKSAFNCLASFFKECKE